jgi:hypothetical protein
MALQNIRSNTASKRPLASGLSDGQIAVNTNETSPGLFFKGANGAVLKVGPVHIGNSAPNSSPAAGGSTGNSVGEQWLDTSNSGFVFKIWDGTAWRSETGEFVDVTGDTMTGDLTISGADLVMQNGEIIAASGAEATPSITFDGDLDTGFYKPAADKLAISTGGTSRVIIDDSGFVGLGTTSPSNLLSLQKDTQLGIDLTRTGAAPSVCKIENVGNLLTLENNVNGISFDTGSSPTEKMRITSDGNVGIGTTAPSALLDVRGASDPQLKVSATNTGTNSAGLFIENQGQRNWQIWVDRPSDQLRIGNNSRATTNLAINSAGNVGIGTSSPSVALEVNGAVSKTSGSFKIDHPLPALTETHHLVHSFVEAPDASNLYAGMVQLSNGVAVVNIDIAHRMTEGTFEALNDPQSWSSSNESGYSPVKSSLSGNLLTIECQDQTSNDTVYYEVRGIRKDQHMIETEWTDESGRVITEPLKQVLADAGL